MQQNWHRGDVSGLSVSLFFASLLLLVGREEVKCVLEGHFVPEIFGPVCRLTFLWAGPLLPLATASQTSPTARTNLSPFTKDFRVGGVPSEPCAQIFGRASP